jgi:hypothetical protein
MGCSVCNNACHRSHFFAAALDRLRLQLLPPLVKIAAERRRVSTEGTVSTYDPLQIFLAGRNIICNSAEDRELLSDAKTLEISPADARGAILYSRFHGRLQLAGRGGRLCGHERRNHAARVARRSPRGFRHIYPRTTLYRICDVTCGSSCVDLWRDV